MKYNKIYHRVALSRESFFNQLHSDLEEVCNGLGLKYEGTIDVIINEETGETETVSMPFGSDQYGYTAQYKITLDEDTNTYIAIKKEKTDVYSGLKIYLYAKDNYVMISETGNSSAGSSNDYGVSYNIFKTEYGFGFSDFASVAKNVSQNVSNKEIKNYIFKLKSLDTKEEKFGCFASKENQLYTSANSVYAYLASPFCSTLELYGIGSNSTYFGNLLEKNATILNVFTNFYSRNSDGYAEHCYIKAASQLDFYGHFTMGGKEFISGSFLAIECGKE